MVTSCTELRLSREKQLELRIYQILRLMSIPMDLRGGKFLFTAIKLCFFDESYMASITKLLYPKIAEMFDTTPHCVEKNIREAVLRAWECSMKEFFERNLTALHKKPGNGVLIKEAVMLLNVAQL